MCPVCDGEAEFEHFGDWYDCKRCKTTGQVAAESSDDTATCSYCLGSGIDANQSFAISGAHIAARYLHLIAAEIHGAEIGISKNPLAVQLIRAPGVVGCVMPMRRWVRSPICSPLPQIRSRKSMKTLKKRPGFSRCRWRPI